MGADMWCSSLVRSPVASWKRWFRLEGLRLVPGAALCLLAILLVEASEAGPRHAAWRSCIVICALPPMD